MEAMLRVRIGEHDAHYGGGLVAGARMMELFGDVATEILIRYDGDEGLFAAYDMVEFKAPIYAGDYLEIKGRITKAGNTSRKMEFEAWKVISSLHDPNNPSAAEVLKEPVLVGRATGTCVVPKQLQRFKHEG
ncbi:MAG: 3-aminobutyryl-CoA ammonia lyase [Firmicutes bacterium]|nr:3-aminobutyryl-CoA ammonia lyase [Bacillota bacterium]